MSLNWYDSSAMLTSSGLVQFKVPVGGDSMKRRSIAKGHALVDVFLT